QVRVPSGKKEVLTFRLAAQNAKLELRGAPAGVVVQAGGSPLSSIGPNFFTRPVGPPTNGILNGAQRVEVAENFESGKTLSLDWNKIAPPPPPQPPSQAELEAKDWEKVRGSADASPIEAFLEKYRNGAHAPQAQALLDNLAWSK